MNRRQLLQSALATSASALLPATVLQAYAAKRPARFQPVREHVLQAIGQGRATGISLAVVHAGQIAWTEGFGLSNREHNLAATPDKDQEQKRCSMIFDTAGEFLWEIINC